MTNTIWPVITAAAVALIGVAVGLLCWWHDRIDSAAFDRGYEEGKRVGLQHGVAQGKVIGAVEERTRQAEAEEVKRRAEEKKRSSPWARDIPRSVEGREFEVASVPYGTVTLRAQLVADVRELDTLTKGELIDRLSAELLRKAKEYVELERYDDPTICGQVFRARLSVLERR